MPLVWVNKNAYEILKKLKRPGQSYSGVVIEHLGDKNGENLEEF